MLVATIAAAIGSVLLHASQREHGVKTDTSRLVAGLGALSAVLLIYRVLIELPAGWQGASTRSSARLLGLLCALGIAWGGYESSVKQRSRAGCGHPALRRRRDSPSRPRPPGFVTRGVARRAGGRQNSRTKAFATASGDNRRDWANMEAFSRDDWILGGVTLLLIIDLLFLPWFSISVGPITVTATATSDPDGWLGILARAGGARADRRPGDRAAVARRPRCRRSAAAALRRGSSWPAWRPLLVALKFLFNIHFSYFGFGFYLAVILTTAALVYFALQASKGASLIGGVRGARR